MPAEGASFPTRELSRPISFHQPRNPDSAFLHTHNIITHTSSPRLHHIKMASANASTNTSENAGSAAEGKGKGKAPAEAQDTSMDVDDNDSSSDEEVDEVRVPFFASSLNLSSYRASWLIYNRII